MQEERRVEAIRQKRDKERTLVTHLAGNILDITDDPVEKAVSMEFEQGQLAALQAEEEGTGRAGSPDWRERERERVRVQDKAKDKAKEKEK